MIYSSHRNSVRDSYDLLKLMLSNSREGQKILVLSPMWMHSKALWKEFLSQESNCSSSFHLDHAEVVFNGKTIIFAPTGDGRKVCGWEPNHILFLNEREIDRDVYDTIIKAAT